MTVTKQGTLDLPATLQTSLDSPGTVLVEFKGKQGDKEFKALAGAVAAPEKIAPSAARPDDFDEFWKAKIEQLEAIPTNPQLEPADAGKADVDYFKLRLDNINGSHVYGQLAKPQKEGKYPAMLIVQYAGGLRIAQDQRDQPRRQGLAGAQHHGPTTCPSISRKISTSRHRRRR